MLFDSGGFPNVRRPRHGLTCTGDGSDVFKRCVGGTAAAENPYHRCDRTRVRDGDGDGDDDDDYDDDDYDDYDDVGTYDVAAVLGVASPRGDTLCQSNRELRTREIYRVRTIIDGAILFVCYVSPEHDGRGKCVCPK